MDKKYFDEIFSLNSEFNLDQRKNKINGGIGIYLDNSDQPFVFPVVQKVAYSMDFSNFNYLPIKGDPIFLQESAKLIFGNKLYSEYDKFLIKQGTVGGTNGIFIWGKLITLSSKNPTIILGNPTWENHKKIFSHLNFNIIEYPHLDSNGKFNLSDFKQALKNHPKSFVLFQGGPTHNPTGINPTLSQWKTISKLILENKSYVLFDSAYLGFGDNIQRDSSQLRLFLKNHIPMAIVISYSKNMSLYQQRTGCLIIPSFNHKVKETIEQQLKYIFRIVNSNPPAFGENIVKNILLNKTHKTEWLQNLMSIKNTIIKRRQLFNSFSKNKFSYVTKQKGLFSILNISKKQIFELKKIHGIYLLSNGRINFGGISNQKIQEIAKAILSTF